MTASARRLSVGWGIRAQRPLSRGTSTGWSDRAVYAVSLLALIAGVGSLFFIVGFLVHEALPAIATFGAIADFLWRDPWVPLADPPLLGVRHAWVSTLYITLISLVFSVPVGLAIAIFASEMAPPRVQTLLQPCLEVLAGIPSVVYGFFGFVTLVAWFEPLFGMTIGVGVLTAGIIVAIMVLPFIASTSAEALRAVPADLRRAGHSLGVTRAHVITRIVLPAAMPGIFAGVALGFARGIGETLAALMLAGNSLAVPTWILDRGQTLTGLIATDIGEAGLGTLQYHRIFAAALALLVIVLAINISIQFLRRRMVRHAG